MNNLRYKEIKRIARREKFLNSKLSKMSVSDMGNKNFSIVRISPHYTISAYISESTLISFHNGSMHLYRYHSGNCQSLQVKYANRLIKRRRDGTVNMKESKERAEFMMLSIFKCTGSPTRIFFDINESILELIKDILGIYFTNFRVKRYRNGNGNRMVSLIGDTDMIMRGVMLRAYKKFSVDNFNMPKADRIMKSKRILELKDID